MNKPCKNCHRQTNNPSFCSRSCSATYTNKGKKKRPLIDKFCRKCNIKIDRRDWKDRRKLCNSCNSPKKDWSKISYKDTKNLRHYQVNSRIRDLARRLFIKSNKPKQCYNCNYNKHFEVCHIKAISSFSDDTPINEINKLSNLVGLCPNCHWELDHGLLKLDFPEFDNLHS